ncbi:TRAP transporter substrate-binding protein DctP [Moorella sulfitireducens (nom. illeg.)]|uniref:TRAP transporter substrate-binding protein DctP n=1 Tax=Neomoorella sulfitireducens TaxID=2972948 RepID=UPI0021AC9DE5|nr:TRAP transporter substrate-binding protein DctP [Moorella sulfitireducens]
MKKNSWWVILLLMVVLVWVLILGGCAKTKETGTAGKQQPSEQPQVYELNINNHNPAQSNIGMAFEEWKKWLEEKSGGRLKITIHHGGSLLKGNEVFRGVQTLFVDGGNYVLDREDGFLLNLFITLPCLGLPSEEAAIQIYKDLLNKFPEMQAEWQGVKPIAFKYMLPAHIHTVKKPVKTPQDLKGVKMFAAESMLAEALSKVNASPVELDIADMYTSLERGLIEGVVNHFAVLSIFRVLELLPYHTTFGEGGFNRTPQFIIINKEKFDKLPPDLQQLIEQAGDVWAKVIAETTGKLVSDAINQCKANNHTFIEIPSQDMKVWYEAVKPVHDKLIEECEAKGLPGKAVYEETLQLIQRYQSN